MRGTRGLSRPEAPESEGRPRPPAPWATPFPCSSQLCPGLELEGPGDRGAHPLRRYFTLSCSTSGKRG